MTPPVVVSRERPDAPDVVALLEQHLDFARATSPPEDVHALDVTGLLTPGVWFVAAREQGRLVGVGALADLGGGHAELKSMHTRAGARGRGVARSVLEHLLAVAREQGRTRVSLETGSMAAFAPARRLYETAGFVPCAPFGSYVASPHSAFFTLAL